VITLRLIVIMLHLAFPSSIILPWFKTQFEFCKLKVIKQSGRGSWCSKFWKKLKNRFPLTTYRGFCTPEANI